MVKFNKLIKYDLNFKQQLFIYFYLELLKNY